jgi:hypothetical protein
MVFLVFPTPLLISSKLFQVARTSQDACRIDGEHLLSSLLVWSGHPPPISYSSHTKPSKYILWFNLKILDNSWVYFIGGMGARLVLQQISPLDKYWHLQLPHEAMTGQLGLTCIALYITNFLWAFHQPCESQWHPSALIPESLALLPLPIFTFLLCRWMLLACISAQFYTYIINNFE